MKITPGSIITLENFIGNDMVIRNKGNEVNLDLEPVNMNDQAFKNAATIYVEKGYSGDPNTVAFRAGDVPNNYFKHVGHVLRLSVFDDYVGFKNDIDYFVEAGLADPKGVSFRSKSYPNCYLYFINDIIMIKDKEISQDYNQRATWYPRIGIALEVEHIAFKYKTEDVKT